MILIRRKVAAKYWIIKSKNIFFNNPSKSVSGANLRPTGI